MSKIIPNELRDGVKVILDHRTIDLYNCLRDYARENLSADSYSVLFPSARNSSTINGAIKFLTVSFSKSSEKLPIDEEFFVHYLSYLIISDTSESPDFPSAVSVMNSYLDRMNRPPIENLSLLIPFSICQFERKQGTIILLFKNLVERYSMDAILPLILSCIKRMPSANSMHFLSIFYDGFTFSDSMKNDILEMISEMRKAPERAVEHSQGTAEDLIRSFNGSTGTLQQLLSIGKLIDNLNDTASCPIDKVLKETLVLLSSGDLADTDRKDLHTLMMKINEKFDPKSLLVLYKSMAEQRSIISSVLDEFFKDFLKKAPESVREQLPESILAVRESYYKQNIKTICSGLSNWDTAYSCAMDFINIVSEFPSIDVSEYFESLDFTHRSFLIAGLRSRSHENPASQLDKVINGLDAIMSQQINAQ